MEKPWNRPAPKRSKGSGGLTAAEKARAQQYARKAGRPYPNLVDNMRVIKERKRG
jgi:hypothetical protein